MPGERLAKSATKSFCSGAAPKKTSSLFSGPLDHEFACKRNATSGALSGFPAPLGMGLLAL